MLAAAMLPVLVHVTLATDEVEVALEAARTAETVRFEVGAALGSAQRPL